jgi:hypothetical protein
MMPRQRVFILILKFLCFDIRMGGLRDERK